jgi:hypothetical protein
MTLRSCDEPSSPTTRPDPCPEARYPARELTATGTLGRTGAIPRPESLVPTVLPGFLFGSSARGYHTGLSQLPITARQGDLCDNSPGFPQIASLYHASLYSAVL